ncbi:COATOMER ZETA SUBUNIT [Encephalitozoon cuniculi GB-M1]|uniref:Coatomer subunit zeta n=2 Tax=Encephalitozoon cuniculi TaxID=6035 RepID=COPZ_ENCCU|nr:vesicle coat complex COPI subunit zeta [Encephalitozoon cuniculi GB-M1]Q8SRD1.1 RecName: Full=Coatomer subunit zeta; AltName: Full=Zeta-coat protein; Short=Zeta-COP [Encephalitozoon cuniculi GB-M1]AGE95158.1 coatomer zeta subunit [Encephalitozoon cuniculi]KMV65596.1 vesicle coat complex COPI subunit zeta [Encephalitozoon cuniculi EcunIII-L]UYI26998.1 coatmer subunit zeta [Encephalitozoon cuniculi]CAD26373.1 COATOMER ZETA SUBUNIT [Encephalitozoon cuniculi GB-M1]
MNLFDIEGLLVADSQGEILYRRVFSKEEEIAAKIAEKAAGDRESISMFYDRIVMCKRLDEVLLIIYSPMDVNEPFVGQVFDEFTAAFIGIVKTPTRERVWKKYDQIVLLVAEFLYEGIVMSGKSDEMLDKLPKRNFEGVDGMKVPRGFASFLHKATKSLSIGSNK